MLANLTFFTAFSIALAVAFCWLLYSRWHAGADKGIPLLIWVCAAVYLQAYDGSLPLTPVLAGICCALLMRFEFMGGWVAKTVRMIESGVIVLLLARLLFLIRGR